MIKQFGILDAHPIRPPSGSNVFHYYGLTDGRLFWQTPTEEIQLTATIQWQHEIVTLDGTQIANKAVNLSDTPVVENSLIVGVEGSPFQVQDVSYSLSGSSLVWTGTDWDGFLEVGDVLSIKYLY